MPSPSGYIPELACGLSFLIYLLFGALLTGLRNLLGNVTLAVLVSGPAMVLIVVALKSELAMVDM
jgi:hypothetical protein